MRIPAKMPDDGKKVYPPADFGVTDTTIAWGEWAKVMGDVSTLFRLALNRRANIHVDVAPI